MTTMNRRGRSAAVATAFAITISAPGAAEEAYFGGMDDAAAPAAALAPLPETSVSDFRALLYHTARPQDRDAVEAGLVGTGLFGAADIDAADMRLPLSVDQLMEYDCVYVWTGFNNYDQVARGDDLADYVDAGGGVVLAVAALVRTDLPGFAIRGRIATPSYSPLDANVAPHGAGVRSLDMATAVLDHPILEGVTELRFTSNPGFSRVTLDPGATLVGTDDLGAPAIAISSVGDVAAFNISFRPIFNPSAGAYRALANACGAVAVIEVEIDVRPDSFENVLNLGSHGVVPVAIFGSLAVDVADIDVSTLRLADAGVKVVGKKNKELCAVGDIDLDGLDDLLCKFETVDMGALDGASTRATLKGSLHSGRRIRGDDVVTIVKE